MTRRLLFLLLSFVALLFPQQEARAQDVLVVAVCGTLPLAYAPGATRLQTVDVNGKLCTSGGGGGGGGTVTSVSVTTANGISGVVATPATTPAISLTLGAITPSSVAIGAGSAITSSGAGGALGTAAFASTGTSGATVPLLNAANTSATGQIVDGTLRLGTVSSTTGQLLLANSASANLTTIQAGNAANARTYTWPTDFGAAGTVLTDAAGDGTLSWGAAGGGTFPPTGCVTANGVIFNNATPCDAGLTKASGATGIVTAGGVIRTSSAGTAAAPSISVGNLTTGLYSTSTTLLGLSVNGVDKLNYSSGTWVLTSSIFNVTTGANAFLSGGVGSAWAVPSTYNFAWTNSAAATGTVDTVLNRVAAGVVGVGTTAGTTGGTIAAASVRSTGTVPTGNTGTCNTAVTVAGGATAGTWTSTAICAIAGTIILTAMPTQTTGYVCFMSDRTTAGVVIEETATTATTATFIVRALPTGAIATVANDILQYSCTGY